MYFEALKATYRSLHRHRGPPRPCLMPPLGEIRFSSNTSAFQRPVGPATRFVTSGTPRIDTVAFGRRRYISCNLWAQGSFAPGDFSMRPIASERSRLKVRESLGSLISHWSACLLMRTGGDSAIRLRRADLIPPKRQTRKVSGYRNIGKLCSFFADPVDNEYA